MNKDLFSEANKLKNRLFRGLDVMPTCNNNFDLTVSELYIEYISSSDYSDTSCFQIIRETPQIFEDLLSKRYCKKQFKEELSRIIGIKTLYINNLYEVKLKSIFKYFSESIKEITSPVINYLSIIFSINSHFVIS